jgi:peptidyl-prolyl cis-trans isomerase SurA
MPRLGLFLIAFAASFSGAVVLDRIAVIVGKHAIKLSDIEHELRLTEFLNNQPLDLGAAARKQAADHLIDQAVIRDEIALEGYGRANDAQATAMLSQFRKNRFGGSDARLRASLERYGITEKELHDHLLWQMTVLDFIDQRFRSGVMVNDADIRKYYDTHLDALKKQHPRDFSYETLEPQIRTVLEAEQVNQQFEAWLDESRKNTRIQYLNGAFQ